MFIALFHFTCPCQASSDSEHLKDFNCADLLKGKFKGLFNIKKLPYLNIGLQYKVLRTFLDFLKCLLFLYYSEDDILT